MDQKSPFVRGAVLVAGLIVLVALVVTCAGPLFWLFKAATSTSTETLAQPFALWPSGLHWENLVEAWSSVRFGTYLRNTLVVCVGTWFFGLLVATTGGYGLAVLRPAYAKVVSAAVLATLFIPGVISLVSLYLTVVNVPLFNVNLLNTFWAVWLPASASAFNVLLMSRFFQAIPRDLFDAARIDGAGAYRVFWSLVLPLARPILGVVSLLTLIGAYKDFLWPLLVLPNPDLQPISVALPRVESSTDLGVFMAALFISVVIPVLLFLAFQRQFLRAAGSAGAIKE
ncbi:binding-protein-dependent transport systems inner membrane component [Beutenbergia cavernae DSM 12333]|uniref:Binding-protein-dependent transport systems inner membrane component n=1 Tax=Beutenbergia cavernae (strain ATCC BAA-8 / DSM 12333 / CCUG 43141 / JCM 11478 / NBRC 16432 / NCIMB 13614 / HKI 0122) TaxID=471853 RepID=C5BZK1_BEUC1|nr:carbohydrate ABC transporter permease [Beutenbergia cavernae]ACQ79173.1 binding-protein-dependent transport systems inner membrane component [Beutenbergia cavernae DSM 12333]